MNFCINNETRDNTNNSIYSSPVPKVNQKGNIYGELSSALKSLTLEEREKVMYDIHGVSDIPGETPSWKAEKLLELSDEVAKMVRGKDAYEMARGQSTEYVDNEEFRLKFLRKFEWDAKKAARNLIRYFNAKLEIFGENCLTKTITQADLSPGAKKCLECGFLQTLSVRDTAGRVVLFFWPLLLEKVNIVSVEDQVACVWYIFMTACKDIETSIKGIVVINCLLNADKSKLQPKQAHQIASLSDVIPYRIRAGHICVSKEDDQFQIVLIIMKAADAISKLRIKYHSGSHMEIKYQLQTYGIPERVLPFSKNGEPTIDSHMKWIQRLKEAEEEETHKEKITDKEKIRVMIPSNKDVLSGRGRFVQDFVGNVHFRHLIASSVPEYENCEDIFRAKGQVADKVIDDIHSSGGRFLKDDGIGWVVLDEKAVHDKVTMTFRSRRKPRKKEKDP